MKTLSYFAASAAQVAKHPVSVMKLEWKGATGLAAARFLQVHDSYTAAAEGAAPLKCWPIYTDAPGFKLFDVGELNLLNGCYICISTTEATKTLASGADDFSTLTVELDRAEEPNGTSFAGDLTTDDEILQVWSEATGAKRLFEIIVTNPDVTNWQLQIHAADAPSDASLVQNFNIPASTTRRLTFGPLGRDIKKIVSGAVKLGCTLAWSSTSANYSAIGGVLGPIQAEYK